MSTPTDSPNQNTEHISDNVGHTDDEIITPTEPIPPDNQTSTSSDSYPRPQDNWTKSNNIELVNIIGEPGEGMLTRSMAAKLKAASANECLFVDFISVIEPKNVKEAMTHPSWVQAM